MDNDEEKGIFPILPPFMASEDSIYTIAMEEKIKREVQYKKDYERKMNKFSKIMFKEKEIQDYFLLNKLNYGIKYAIKELNIDNLRIDIFAIGQNNVPYIIELKKDRNKYIVGQAIQYMTIINKYTLRIENDLNYNNIEWNKLCVICIAPDFYERDYSAYKYCSLNNKIHFYRLSVNSKNGKIDELIIDYLGPEKNGPILIEKRGHST